MVTFRNFSHIYIEIPNPTLPAFQDSSNKISRSSKDSHNVIGDHSSSVSTKPKGICWYNRTSPNGVISKRRNLTLDLAPHSSTSSPFYHRRISIGQQKQTLQQASPEHSRLLETPLPRVVASVSSGHQRAFSALGNPAAPSVSVLPLPPRKPPNRSSHHAADYLPHSPAAIARKPPSPP